LAPASVETGEPQHHDKVVGMLGGAGVGGAGVRGAGVGGAGVGGTGVGGAGVGGVVISSLFFCVENCI